MPPQLQSACASTVATVASFDWSGGQPPGVRSRVLQSLPDDREHHERGHEQGQERRDGQAAAVPSLVPDVTTHRDQPRHLVREDGLG